MKRTKEIGLCLLLMLSWCNLFAQKEKTIRMFMNDSTYPEIELIVGVRDSQSGEGVYGLKKPDFTIYENDKKQEITSFLATEKGKYDAIDIVFLFDQTGSMGDEINAVKNNSLLFADILEESEIDYRLAIITFSDRIEKKFGFTSDIEKFKKQVASIKIVGGGDYPENDLEALKQASELKLRKNARTAFILITDAPYHEKDQVTELVMKPLVKRLALRDIQVYPIAIQLPEYLWIAKETNGAYFNILDDFSSIIEELAYGLTSQYRLRYITSNPCPDGSTVEVKLHISPIASSTTGDYKRPLNFNQLDLNFLYASEDITMDPQKPIECNLLSIRASIRATSCSEIALIKNIIVRLYDIKPGERTEVARSEPLTLQSNGQPKDALLEWNTAGYRGDRRLELVIDPGKILEKSKEDNILRKNIYLSEVAHDLYIESIEYEPNPVEPCDVVRLSVKANDGTECEGLTLHDIELEAFDGKKSIGKLVTSIKIGEPEAVIFEWDAAGSLKPKLLKFIVDPDRRFKELTRDNNVKEVMINIKPVQHELSPVKISHEPEKRPMVGDIMTFYIEVKDEGHCPGVPLGEKIRLRLSDAGSRLTLAESQPFTLSTDTGITVPIKWTPKLNDNGKRELQVTVDPHRKIREKKPPGFDNNSINYTVDILPMPHDLVIESASISPKEPIDGEPAALTVVVKDNARFPGVRLENVRIKAFERYSGASMGQSEPTFVYSLQNKNIVFQIDTGGMAGHRELMLEIDPENQIKELTPEKLDGENNNRYYFKVKIHEQKKISTL
jgi:hypothetical protein